MVWWRGPAHGRPTAQLEASVHTGLRTCVREALPIPTEKLFLGLSTRALSTAPLGPWNSAELCPCLQRISLRPNAWLTVPPLLRRLHWPRSLHTFRIFVRCCVGHYRPWTPVRGEALVGIGFHGRTSGKDLCPPARICVVGVMRVVCVPYNMWAERCWRGFDRGGIHVPPEIWGRGVHTPHLRSSEQFVELARGLGAVWWGLKFDVFPHLVTFLVVAHTNLSFESSVVQMLQHRCIE